MMIPGVQFMRIFLGQLAIQPREQYGYRPAQLLSDLKAGCLEMFAEYQ